MIRHTGTVLRVEGDLAWVECVRGGACAICPGRGACETAAFATPARRHRLRARTGGAFLAPGTKVVIGIPPGALLRAALLAYAWPLAGLLAGTVLAAVASPAVGGVGAGLGLCLGIVLATWAGRSSHTTDLPVVLDRLPS
jgi:positive regulator of sigma E activity